MEISEKNADKLWETVVITAIITRHDQEVLDFASGYISSLAIPEKVAEEILTTIKGRGIHTKKSGRR